MMIITTAGQAAIANALANGAAITVQDMAFGTTDRVPDGTEAALDNEVLRKPILTKATDQGGLRTVFASKIDADDGPFLLFEVGLFDDTGTLLFIGRLEALNKSISDDAAEFIEVRTLVLTSHFESLVVQIEDAFAGVSPGRQIVAGEGLAGGGDLSQDREFALAIQTLPTQASGLINLSADMFAMYDADHEGNPRHVKMSTETLGNTLLRLPSFSFAPTARNLSAGVGLSGGGTLALARTKSACKARFCPTGRVGKIRFPRCAMQRRMGVHWSSWRATVGMFWVSSSLWPLMKPNPS